MTVRTEVIADIFQAWLKRYSPPQSMKNDAEVMKAERDTLLRVLLKFAPQSDYDGWLNRALDRLEYQMKTRAWPTKGELGAVCSNLRKEAASGEPRNEWRLDPVRSTARKMNDGEPVGDQWIYGTQAVELLRAGLVDQSTMKRYRSGFFFAMKDVWGEQQARLVEGQYILKHEAAEQAWKEQARRIPERGAA